MPSSATTVSPDGLSISHSKTDKYQCISTSKPLPSRLDRFYFEVTLKSTAISASSPSPAWPTVSIGFCTAAGAPVTFPGAKPRPAASSVRSWGYHGDGGGFFSSESGGRPPMFGPQCCKGNTVGCGVDLLTHTMWFTLNGWFKWDIFENVHGRLFPLIGLYDEIELETNFVGPYLW